jgi:hypothetical protein
MPPITRTVIGSMGANGRGRHRSIGRGSLSDRTNRHGTRRTIPQRNPPERVMSAPAHPAYIHSTNAEHAERTGASIHSTNADGIGSVNRTECLVTSALSKARREGRHDRDDERHRGGHRHHRGCGVPLSAFGCR